MQCFGGTLGCLLCVLPGYKNEWIFDVQRGRLCGDWLDAYYILFFLSTWLKYTPHIPCSQEELSDWDLAQWIIAGSGAHP